MVMVSSMPIGRNSKQKTKSERPATRRARRVKQSALLIDAKELLIHARYPRRNSTTLFAGGLGDRDAHL
jgi:hypothetical protein